MKNYSQQQYKNENQIAREIISELFTDKDFDFEKFCTEFYKRSYNDLDSNPSFNPKVSFYEKIRNIAETERIYPNSLIPNKKVDISNEESSILKQLNSSNSSELINIISSLDTSHLSRENLKNILEESFKNCDKKDIPKLCNSLSQEMINCCLENAIDNFDFNSINKDLLKGPENKQWRESLPDLINIYEIKNEQKELSVFSNKYESQIAKEIIKELFTNKDFDMKEFCIEFYKRSYNGFKEDNIKEFLYEESSEHNNNKPTAEISLMQTIPDVASKETKEVKKTQEFPDIYF